MWSCQNIFIFYRYLPCKRKAANSVQQGSTLAANAFSSSQKISVFHGTWTFITAFLYFLHRAFLVIWSYDINQQNATLTTIIIFTMSSTWFEPDGSSSGRRLYTQVWRSLFAFNRISSLQPKRLLIPLHVNLLNHTCSYSRFPDDEPSGSKHVEDIYFIQTNSCTLFKTHSHSHLKL